MAQNASVNKRSGDEYYTKKETVLEVLCRYKVLFDKFDYVWLPFNSEHQEIYSVCRSVLGDDKVLLTPQSCYDDSLGFPDFFKWKCDKVFFDKVTQNKTLVFDNPPFSLWSKIVREELLPNNISYILFGDSMTALNRVKMFNCGYRILGRVPFENCDPKKRINISLFSDLWDDIKYEFGLGTDKADNSNGAMTWTDRVNIQKYKDRDGEISSAEIINVCLRNYVFYLNRIDRAKKSKKFGGGVFYKF